MKLRETDESKTHFRSALSERTWADIEEKWPWAAVTRTYAMTLIKPEGKICVSLACGLGRFLRDYTTRKASLVVGLDINVENLSKCKGIGAELIRCDLENMPVRSRIVGGAECFATTEHLLHPERVLIETERILQKDGMAVYSWRHYRWREVIVDKTVRMRLMLSLRDAFCDILPSPVRERLTAHSLFSRVFKGYHLYRNRGYSTKDIQELYRKTSMQVLSQVGAKQDKNIIVASMPQPDAT